MEIKLLLDEVDKSAYFKPESFIAEDLVASRINTCEFTLEGLHTITEGKTEVIVCNDEETVRVFGGVLAAAGIEMEGKTKRCLCQCQDFTILLDSVVVNELYEDKTDAYIINDLFTKYLPEIDGSTYVDTGQTHARILFNRLTLREVMDILSTGSGLDWRVDYWKYLHYAIALSENAPFNISDEPDYAASYPASELKYKRDATTIKNSYYVVGNSYRSGDTDFELAGNAQTTELLLPYGLHAPEGESGVLIYRNDGSDVAPSWTQLTVGVDYIDSLGGGIDVLYNYQQKLLKFGTAPPNLKRAVKITGRYDVPILMHVKSQPSYEVYGRWFDGKIVNKDIKSLEEARLAGKGALAKTAFVKETGSYVTDVDGLHAGQRQRITNADRGIDGYYLINRVTTTILGTACRHEVSFGEYNSDLVDMIVALKAASGQHQDMREDEILNELNEYTDVLTVDESVTVYTPSAGVPEGGILIWTGTLANIPTGFLLCNGDYGTPNLIARFLRGAAASVNPGGTGGSDTHTHDQTADGAHSHTLQTAGAHTHITGSGGAHNHGAGANAGLAAGSTLWSVDNVGAHTHTTNSAGGHTHTTNEASDHTHDISTDDGRPPFYEVAFVQAGEGGADADAGIVIIWGGAAADIPSGWALYDGNGGRPDLRGYFLRGVDTDETNPGTTGGAATHGHTEANNEHSHSSVSSDGAHSHTHNAYTWTHNHKLWTSAPGGTPATQNDAGAGNHTHGATDSIGSHTHTLSGSSSHTHVVDAASSLPPYTYGYFIGSTGETRIPQGGILIWTGTLANIPTNYLLCDGQGGRPDYRTYFIRGAANDGEIGTTGGSETHTHTDSSSGNHSTHGTVSSAGTHQHAPTDTVGAHTHATTTTPAYPGGSSLSANSSGGGHSHTYPNEGNHTHTLSDPGNHSHGLESASSLPAYYDVAFIIKV